MRVEVMYVCLSQVFLHDQFRAPDDETAVSEDRSSAYYELTPLIDKAADKPKSEHLKLLHDIRQTQVELAAELEKAAWLGANVIERDPPSRGDISESDQQNTANIESTEADVAKIKLQLRHQEVWTATNSLLHV